MFANLRELSTTAWCDRRVLTGPACVCRLTNGSRRLRFAFSRTFSLLVLAGFVIVLVVGGGGGVVLDVVVDDVFNHRLPATAFSFHRKIATVWCPLVSGVWCPLHACNPYSPIVIP